MKLQEINGHQNYESIIVHDDRSVSYVIRRSSDDLFDTLHHRIDGPAMIGSKYVAWFLYGDEIRKTRTFCIRLNMSDEDTCLWLLKYGETLPISRDFNHD